MELSAEEYDRWIGQPFVDDVLGGSDGVSLVMITGRPGTPIASPGSLPVVVAWVGDGLGGDGPEHADVVIGGDDVNDLVDAVSAAPIAAATLAVLLRSQPGRGTESGLAAESAAYSLLQGGPEFAAWRSASTAAPDERTGPCVVVDRAGSALTVTLDRPDRHNAISTRLRDEWSAALWLAVTDDSITTVELRGAGPSFCSGGDLAEFGTRPDPATAHVTRLARSPARLVDRLGNVTAHVHGHAFGGGIEVASFARRVVADPATRIALPEIGLGLIPGAGGTVGVTRRIGRQRCAALALTGQVIDAPRAHEWGLVDAIAHRRPER